MSRTARSCGVLVLLGALSACSATPTPPVGSATPYATGSTVTQASKLPDPCTLLTVPEINSVVGRTFDAGALNATATQAHVAACDWKGTGAGIVQVLVSNLEAFDASRATADVVYGVSDTNVPGVPHAYVVKGGFLIGLDAPGYFVQVSYITPDPNVAAITVQLAAQVAKHLS